MLHVRVASPEDYDRIVSVVDKWWGRPVSTGLPRLFLDHFWASSRVADDAEGLAGFLVAFGRRHNPNSAMCISSASVPTSDPSGWHGRSTSSSSTTLAPVAAVRFAL